MSPFQAFCLYGPEGNGKRTLALALAGDLGRAGYSFVRISAEDLRGQSETEERQNWSTFLGEIPEAAREAGGICVLVEDFAFFRETSRLSADAARRSAESAESPGSLCFFSLRRKRQRSGEYWKKN